VRLSVPILCVCAMLEYSTPASAHHSYAMYDRSKEVRLEGVVKEFQFTNPHIFIEMVVGSGAAAKSYSVEGTSTGILRRAGWTYNLLKPGDRISVLINPLKDGRSGGGFLSMVKNGTVWGEGSERVPSAPATPRS
jgi:hypothetical protein